LIKYISDSEFEESVLKQKKVILANFFSKLCPPSKELEDIINSLKDDERYDIVKLDADKNASILKKYGIDSVPAIVIFKNGEKKKGITGILEREELLKILNKYI
jgi:thioredoxin 1